MAWYLWVDDDKVGANCSDLSTLSERSTGFQGGKAAVAKNVNVALRQASLVAVALMECMGLTTYNYATSKDNLKNAILGTFTANLRNGNAQYSVCGKLQSQSAITGPNNFVFGFNNESEHSNCTIFGSNNTTAGSDQFVIGNYAKLQTDTLFAIGIGTSTETKNALTVTKAGQVQVANEPQAATDVIRKEEYNKLVDGTQAVGNATNATNANAADKINVTQPTVTNITRTGLYACNVMTSMGDESTVMIAIRDLSSDVYGLGAYYDGKLTYGGVKYNSTYKRIDVVNAEVFSLVTIYLITAF